ncbi:MAG: B12-binding domain-containing radical SAM protein [Kiritimatiellae bacterium]|nr:B12-binding domain-containing radical SAM protein [Verrucomicrobiota bacterium]MBU4291521.1 B12-binding domain-containing radical SAM protein [Verrucomicrobiota bacterium]MCG2678646.1 B12-binding domain-containing radical SAM protein [Kiritimatiellia bacterium]
MKIVVGYPPTRSAKGLALLSQNRQFQWFSHETRIFPVVLAGAATMAQQAGHKVIWKDAIAENMDTDEFRTFLRREKPDLFLFETKTPVVRLHWLTAQALKSEFPALQLVVCGDHVTARPEETLQNAPVDFVLCGGDYDFLLGDLLRHLTTGAPLPGGIVYRQNGQIAGHKHFELNHKLDEAPFIDRRLTRWDLYQKEYNLRGHPFMYIMSGRDCWHGKCTFCAWTVMYPRFRVRSPENVLDEIGRLIDEYQVTEIFDDSGTLNTGPWLARLCEGLQQRGYSRKIRYSCNMRFGALEKKDYEMMRQAGFRLLKFGLESANQETLDRLQKKTRVEQIEEGCRWAKEAGLTVHLTMIVGFPWETREDALRTLGLARKLMLTGKADLLQATTVVPYPGTPLYEQALKENGFLFDPQEYERFDMNEPVLKTRMSPEEVRKICGQIYSIFLSPRYMWHRLKAIRGWDDIAFLLRGARAVLGHLKDFGRAKRI